MSDFFIALAIILGGGIISMILPLRLRGAFYCAAIAVAALLIGKTIYPLLTSFSAATYPSASFLWSYPAGEIRMLIDPLAAFFILIIAAGIFINSFFAWKLSLRRERSRFHLFFLSLLAVAMLLVVTTRNMIAFIAFWEVMTGASFALIMLRHDKLEEFPFRVNYFVAMHIGMLLILAAFLIASVHTGSYDIASLAAITDKRLSVIIFLLLFAGFSFKAEFVPFHPWLPIVHPEIPSHVSSIFSGVMMKTGIYGILRSLGLFGSLPEWTGYLILSVALITTMYGVLCSLPQKDVKKLLAFSSVENIGICGIGIGAGMIATNYGYISAAFLAYAGALLHALNHSLFKPLLFHSAGTVQRFTGERNMEQLGGLIHRMPATATFFLIGSLAITAMPFLNGFVGEFCIYLGLLKGTVQAENIGFVVTSVFAISLLALAGAMALVVFAKAFSIIFLGSYRGKVSFEGAEISAQEMTGSIIITAAIVGIGLFPHAVLLILKNPAEQIIGADVTIHYINSYFILQKLSFVSISLLLLLCTFVFLRLLFSAGRMRKAGTWGCGYDKPSAKIQYTGYSFSENLTSLLDKSMDMKIKRKRAEGLFPRGTSFVSYSFDLIDSEMYRPLMKRVRILLSHFGSIQGGRTQVYILYGLIFCVAVILWIILGG